MAMSSNISRRYWEEKYRKWREDDEQFENEREEFMSKHIKHGEDLPSTIVAVDFDGTLCEHKFPEIGRANNALIAKLIDFRIQGGKLILWTCREGKHLYDAVVWCKKLGLEFDAVNDNVDVEYCKKHNFAQRKVVAHIYIDDRNWSTKEAMEML